MKSHLIDLERRALALRNSGQLKEAAELFHDIVKEQPDWEHGGGFYNLACCYEDLGNLDLAEKYYLESLRYEANNPYFLGGYASFQHLHRDTKIAFETYLTLLKVESSNKHQKGVESAVTALRALGKRMGLADEAVADKIRRVVPSFIA